MNARTLKAVFICFGCILLLNSAAAFAENKKAYTLDGVEYTKDQLIDDFLNVAFSDLPWNADAGEEERQKILQGAFPPEQPLTWWETIFGRAEKTKPGRKDDWMADHIARNLTLPLNQRDVITKWEGSSISIGLGWPRYGVNSGRDPSVKQEGSDPNEGIRKYFPNFEDRISRSLADISAATGLSVTLVHEDDPPEDAAGFSRIRIVPFWGNDIRSWLQSPCYICGFDVHEEGFLNGILFQSYSRFYFDGYLLPDTSSALDVSICKVVPSLDDRLLTTLINECLVRSLGFPAMSNSRSSLMSHWRVRPEDPISNKRLDVIKLGNKFLTNPEDKLNKLNDPKISKAESDGLVKRYLQRRNVVSIHAGVLEGFETIPAYDKAMISLLYCPSIKSGMDKEEVKKILSADDTCFSQM